MDSVYVCVQLLVFSYKYVCALLCIFVYFVCFCVHGDTPLREEQLYTRKERCVCVRRKLIYKNII